MKKKNILKYNLDRQEYRVTFCENKESPDISEDLSRLISDKKMLLIIDKKINKEIVKNLILDLTQSDFNISV